MDKLELVQEIGNEVCEGCGPHSDCGEDPIECPRIATAVILIEEYIRRYKGTYEMYQKRW